MKDRIKELMEAQHMNQQTFSHCTGINTATLSSIFTGRTRPTLNIIESIMKKFPEVNINWLMFGQGEMMNSTTENKNMTSSSFHNEKNIVNVQKNIPTASPQILNFDDTNEENNRTYQQVQNQPSRNNNTNYNNSSNNYTQGNTPPSPTQQYTPQNNNTMERYPQTVNMAVMQEFKEEGYPQGYTDRQRIVQSQMKDNNENIIPNLNISSQQKRRVTEIRVFYDDQTWEAFIPKNK